MHVDLLPAHRIPIGIYFVNDPSVAATTIPAAFTGTAATIITRLNEVFRQACVEFVLARVAMLPVGYDTDHDGLYDAPPVMSPPGTHTERDKLLDNTELRLSGKLNLLIVRDIASPDNIGITPERNTLTVPNRSIVETAYFETANPAAPKLELFYLTCVHEIGHALGLSTRGGDFHDYAPDPHLF